MIKRMQSLIAIIIFLTGFSSFSHAENLKSNVIVLFDLSGSYFTSERIKSEIPNNIKQLSNVLGSKRNGPQAPALIQVFPITTTSEIERPICEYKLLRKKLLGGGKKNCGDFDDSFCSSKRKELKEYLNDECSALITSKSAENATDISGALALASQLILGQPANNSYIIIFSDMFEFRVEDLPVSDIKLDGADVLVVCGGFFNTETDSAKLCYGTQDEWKARLEGLGASSVAFTTENVRWASGLAKNLF